MKSHNHLLALLLAASALPAFAAGNTGPARPAMEGCKWEQLSDSKLGLEAWVQRCDLGFRKIDFLTNHESLLIRYSDGGAPDRLVDVLPLLPGETPEAGIKRIFSTKTEKKVARRCVLAPFDGTTRVGVKRYTFIPNAAYARELKTQSEPNEIPDSACGDWGEQPDGIQYFEAQSGTGVRSVLFVRIGQDDPLFDENTLHLLPSGH